MMAEKINPNFEKSHGGWRRPPRKTGGKPRRTASSRRANDDL
jgi:hypothetical protein